MKFNHFAKPSAEPNLFGLCRGGKWTDENEGIIEAFRGGAAAHDCLSEQDRTPLRNAGRIGPATSETMGYSV